MSQVGYVFIKEFYYETLEKQKTLIKDYLNKDEFHKMVKEYI